MKKIFFLSAILMLLNISLKAQEIEVPDYNQIRVSISNPKSPNYYPTLMKRFMENDTTLTLDQYRNLYYGFAIQEDFVPYQNEKEKLLDIRRKFVKEKGSSTVCPEAIRVAKGTLEDNPFDIPAISLISIAYLQLGDTIQYREWDIKQKGILDAILSSGDGEDPSSAFHVIDIEHEYEVLSRLGLQIDKDSLVNSQVEYLKVKPNAEDERGFFFNFGACSKEYKKRYE